MKSKEYTVARTFYDSEGGRQVGAGDTVTATEARARELLRNGLIEPPAEPEGGGDAPGDGAKRKPAKR